MLAFLRDANTSLSVIDIFDGLERLQGYFPKGESMEFLTQKKVNLALAHRNSVIRASLGNVTAARRFAQCYGEDVLEKLGIGEIAPDQVRMTPELVRD